MTAGEKVFIAAVDSTETLKQCIAPWTQRDLPVCMGSVSKILSSVPQKKYISPNEVISTPRVWAEINYADILTVDAKAEIELVVSRGSMLAGYAMWFDTELFEGVVLKNNPGRTRSTYGTLFFPSIRPREVRLGERLFLSIEAISGAHDYELRVDELSKI